MNPKQENSMLVDVQYVKPTKSTNNIESSIKNNIVNINDEVTYKFKKRENITQKKKQLIYFIK